MRLAFDKDGYVSIILYGCTTTSCVEYTGLVPIEPEEYASMEDWADRAQTQAYYLDENGNLAYDSVRADSLCAEDEVVVQRYTNDKIAALGLFDAIYPVGSIYMSINNVNPSTLFGGTWVQIEDRFLLAAGSAYNAGDEGGAEEYNLATTHKHLAPIGASSTAVGAINVASTVPGGDGKSYKTAKIDYSGTLSDDVTMYYTGSAMVSATIPTLPPYLAVYVWQRVPDETPAGYVSFVDYNGKQIVDADGLEFAVKEEVV